MNPRRRHLVELGIVLGAVPAALGHVEHDLDLFQDWRWVRFDDRDGLPGYEVSDLCFDRDAIPWVITSRGVAWYDGFVWHTMLPLATPPTFAEPHPDGGLLVGHGRTVWRLETTTATCVIRLNIEIDDAVVFEGNQLLILDRQARLFIHDGVDLRAVDTPAELSAPARLHHLQDGSVWLTSDQGVFRRVGADWERVLAAAARDVRGDQHGHHLAIARHAEFAGLWTWEDDAAPAYMPDRGGNNVQAMDLAPNGDAIAIYSSGEVRLLSNGQWLWVSPPPQQLVNARVVRMAPNGDLWVGSDRALHLCKRSSTRWHRLADSGPDVNALVRATDGALWIATGNGVVIHAPDGHVERIKSVGGEPLGIVTGLAQAADGAMWVSSGSDFDGAYRVVGNTWTAIGVDAGLPLGRIHRILPDRHMRLWFLGHPAMDDRRPAPGASVLRDGVIEPWGPADGLGHGRVYAFTETADGALWFGTLNGISRWRDGAWTHWTDDDALAADRVFDLYTDGTTVWFGHYMAGHGLGRIAPDDTVHYVTTEDGLVDDRVWSIRGGRDGALWIATSGGLSLYRDGQWAAFEAASGLPDVRLWPVLVEEDRVLVGTRSRGVAVLSLREAAHPAPRVILHRPVVNDDRAVCSWRVQTYRGELPPERVATRMRLNDAPWSRWTTDPRAEFVEPDSGRHTLSVQARGLFGQVSTPATIVFDVPRPWYLQPLFLAVTGAWATVVAMVVIYFAARRRQLQRAAAARQRKLEQQLQHAQKMEAVGQLAAGIGHDFNNLLTAILGYSEWARCAGPMPGEVTEALDGIDRVVHQAAGLTRALRTFVSRPTGEFRVLDLSTTVTSAVAMLKRMLPASIHVSVRTIPAGAAFVRGDDSQLQQLLVNLALNARDALPEGGHLAISLTRSKGAEPGDAGWAILTVTDDGTGMPPEVVDRVFEPFFTTKARERGTGLGLAIVHGVVTAHRGSIDIDSTVGSGTCMTVRLPCCTPAPEIVAPSAPAFEPHRGDRRVLLVEDHAQIRTLIAGALSTAGFDTLTAADGEAGLALYQVHAPGLDAVILDVDLPGRSGDDCLRVIREAAPTLPVVIITGGVDYQLVGTDPATALLRKPFQPARIVALIERLIGRTAPHND